MALVALVGASGSGKSTFAAQALRADQVLSSDDCRGLVSDDENDQSATDDAFDVLHYIAGKRLAAGRLTVVDATNVQRDARASWWAGPGARRAAGGDRAGRAGVGVRAAQRGPARPRLRRPRAPAAARELRRSLRFLAKEGFRRVHVLRGQAEVDAARIVVEPLLNDRRAETGPFDVIGDVHGCRAELEALLARLGYDVDAPTGVAPGRADARCSSVTWSTAGRTRRACCGW